MVPYSIACLLLNFTTFTRLPLAPSSLTLRWLTSRIYQIYIIRDIHSQCSWYKYYILKTMNFEIDNVIKTRYGDIHSVSLFGHPVVVLSSLAAVNDFRAASPENFSHRWTKIVIFLDKEVCIGLEVPYQYWRGRESNVFKSGEFSFQAPTAQNLMQMGKYSTYLELSWSQEAPKHFPTFDSLTHCCARANVRLPTVASNWFSSVYSITDFFPAVKPYFSVLFVMEYTVPVTFGMSQM